MIMIIMTIMTPEIVVFTILIIVLKHSYSYYHKRIVMLIKITNISTPIVRMTIINDNSNSTNNSHSNDSCNSNHHHHHHHRKQKNLLSGNSTNGGINNTNNKKEYVIRIKSNDSKK